MKSEIVAEEEDFTDIDIRPDTIEDRHTEFNMYIDFVQFYVSGVIGLRYFEKHKCQKLYRNYVTVSDEAFAILTIENNWDRWIAMAGTEEWKTSPVPTKWTVTRTKADNAKQKATTTGSQNSEPTARRFRGWSSEGIQRYNQLFDEIKAERQTGRAKRFEEKLLEHFQHKKAKGNKKHKKKEQQPQTPFPVPKHELWSEDTITFTQQMGDKELGKQISTGEDDEEEVDQMPDYAGTNIVNHAV